MHILFLSDNFPPEVNAPASRTYEHCREWVAAGHSVTVLTCAPNFPTGKVFKGFGNRLWQTEEVSGIRVVRVWTYIAANEGFFFRTLDYLSFMTSAILLAPLVRKADVVIGTSPQFFTACAAYVASRCRGIPFIFELRDLWPESIRAVGAMRKSRTLDLLEQLELFLYRRAAKIVSVTRAFKQNLIERGIHHNKISVVTNGVDLSRFRPRKKDLDLERKLGLKGRFVAGYVGTHGMAHALETIVEAAHILQEKGEGKDFHFLLLGGGARKKYLQELAADLGLKNLTFIDTVSKERVTTYWSLLDVSIIHLKNVETFRTVIPSKLFECMGMGIPLLHGVKGESAEIVENKQLGLLFEPENPDSLCHGLRTLRNDRKIHREFQRNCLNASKQYDRKQLAQNMLELIEPFEGNLNSS
tara:strand:- start:1139 stop:2380 length:1242 start_codon:yes stop_codon:yes gene_type:complete